MTLPAENPDDIAVAITILKQAGITPQEYARAGRFDSAEQPPGSWEAVDLNPYIRGEVSDPPPTMLDRVDGINLLYPGKLHWISGEPEGLKSWLAQIAIGDAIMDGLVAFYIDFEDGPAALVARLSALGVSDEAVANRLSYYRPESPMTSDDVAQVLARAARLHPAISVIDGVNAAMGGSDYDPNKTTDFYRWWSMLGAPLRKLTAGPMVAIDHVVKNPEARQQYASGTGQKLAAVDVHLGIDVTSPLGRGLTGQANIVLYKDRPGMLRRHAGKWAPGKGSPLARLVINSDDDSGLIRFAIEPPEDLATQFRPTALMEKVSQFVGRNHDGEPLSKRGICDGVSGKAEYVRLAVDILVRDGYLVAIPKGRYATYLSARPYRELDDPAAGKNLGVRPDRLRQAGHISSLRPGASLMRPDAPVSVGASLRPPLTGDADAHTPSEDAEKSEDASRNPAGEKSPPSQPSGDGGCPQCAEVDYRPFAAGRRQCLACGWEWQS